MNPCGYWAHCALHCDLPCDHNQWCPDFPEEEKRTPSRASSWVRHLLDQCSYMVRP